tara:strand:- start:3900 stop:5153 length:1254 start_codon:yes stop_codon:yes gene_type:complete
MGKNQNGLINHAPALSKGGKSLNDYSEVLINHLNQYSIENYGEPIDEESFMILGNTDSEVKSVFAETKSGVDINIPVSKLYDTFEGGGEITHKAFVSHKMDNAFLNELQDSNISELNELVYAKFERTDTHKAYVITEKQYKAIISNPSIKDKVDIIDFHSQGGRVLIQIIDNKSEADELISTLRSENPNNTYVIENYKGSYAVTETYKGGGEIKEIENDEIEGLLIYDNYEDYSARELKSMSDYHYENKPPLDIVEKMWGIAIEHCNLRWDSPILAFNVGIGDLFKFVDPLDINYIVGYESNEIQRTICDTLYKKNGYPIAIGNDISILNNPRLPSSFKLAIGFDLGTDTFYSNTLHQSIVRDGYMVAILPSKIFNGEGGQYEKKREILNTYYDLVVAYELPSDTMNGFTLVALRKI